MATSDCEIFFNYLIAEYQRPFNGWDFSYLNGRRVDMHQHHRWDYAQFASHLGNGFAARLRQAYRFLLELFRVNLLALSLLLIPFPICIEYSSASGTLSIPTLLANSPC
jgi:hypothetical protein